MGFQERCHLFHPRIHTDGLLLPHVSRLRIISSRIAAAMYQGFDCGVCVGKTSRRICWSFVK